MPVDAQKPTDMDRLEVLVTAEGAFPALERLFSGAERQIWAGFRIFDLSAGLRGPEAREIGDDWIDLFRHTPERGVSITLVLSDLDPVLATKHDRKS